MQVHPPTTCERRETRDTRRITMTTAGVPEEERGVIRRVGGEQRGAAPKQDRPAEGERAVRLVRDGADRDDDERVCGGRRRKSLMRARPGACM